MSIETSGSTGSLGSSRGTVKIETMMTQEEREQFRAKLTAMQDEIRAFSASAA